MLVVLEGVQSKNLRGEIVDVINPFQGRLLKSTNQSRMADWSLRLKRRMTAGSV
jgi:hypothetical protein